MRIFRTRPLAGRYPYLWLDARVEKVREAGSVRQQALMVRLRCAPDGQARSPRHRQALPRRGERCSGHGSHPKKGGSAGHHLSDQIDDQELHHKTGLDPQGCQDPRAGAVIQGGYRRRQGVSQLRDYRAAAGAGGRCRLLRPHIPVTRLRAMPSILRRGTGTRRRSVLMRIDNRGAFFSPASQAPSHSRNSWTRWPDGWRS